MLTKLVRMILSRPDEAIGRATQFASVRIDRALGPSADIADDMAYQLARDHASGKSAAWFASLDDPAATVAALRSLAPHDEQEVIARATAIAEGRAPIFGLGWVTVGSPPEWRREPIAGLSYPLAHWSQIPYLDVAQVGDHKVLWEFNRHQHLIALAQAWHYTGDSRWVSEASRQLDSWLTNNPVGRGMNWASSLEVAYRAISWCWLIRAFGIDDAGDSRLGAALSTRMVKTLAAHARHVEKFLSRWFSPNTHLTGEALGLLYVSLALPMLPDSARWRDLAVAILESQATKQVRADGVYFEQASQYHRYTTEIYLHYALLADRNGLTVSSTVRAVIDRLFEVLAASIRGDGSMAIWGDDDGGRLMQLDGRRPDDLRALLAVGSAFLRRRDLTCDAMRDDAGLLWLLGPDAARIYEIEPASNKPLANAFPDGGLFTIRDGWGRLDGHATFLCGPHGALSCGHSHADSLSIDLFAAGAPLLVDRGTLAYHGEVRQLFRSTAAHNTIEVAGVGASEPDSPFRWKTHTDAVLNGWLHRSKWTAVEGEHRGYARMTPGAVHRRRLVHPAPGIWVIADSLIRLEEWTAVANWHLSPDSVIGTATERLGLDTRMFSVRQPSGGIVSLVLLGGGEVALHPSTVAPQYGCERPAERLEWHLRQQRDLTVHSIVIDWGVYEFSRLGLAVNGSDPAFLTSIVQPPPDEEVMTDVPSLLLNDAPVTFDGLALPAGEFYATPADTSPRTILGVSRAAEDMETVGGNRWIEAANAAGSWQVETGAFNREAI